MKRTLILAAVWSACALAQPTVAPTEETVGSPRGSNVSSYNVVDSFELGYRWHTTGGDADMYRSTVNFGNGIRLLSSSLSVQSRDGHGHYFDQILLNTQGLGNDPYQYASLRIEKNRLYRYDLTWRSNAYFNPGLTIAGGEHAMDTVRHMEDQDFTLFPQGALKLFLGYSHVDQSGPALSTIQLFDSRGDEYPLFSDIRRSQNEYRLGGEVHLAGFRLNVLHGWEDFKEDTTSAVTGVSAGNNPDDLNTLTAFRRAEPYHGTSPYWRGVLFGEGKKFWSANARMTYVAGRRGFVLDEFSTGTSRIGVSAQRQVVSYGSADRPSLAGNFNFSLFPTDKITVSNQTSADSIRMTGNSNYLQFDNKLQSVTFLAFNYLGIRTISNDTDVQVRLKPWITVHGGYAYDNRLIRSAEGAPTPVTEHTNELNSGTLGFRLRPIKELIVNLDGEIGRSNQPVYPISEKDYHAFRGRVEYRRKTFRASAFARSSNNTNSVSLSSYASKSRQYGVDGSWTGVRWFSIDAGYSKLHLDTLGGLAFFLARSQEDASDQSYYVSNLHTATLAARFSVRSRADVSIGYSHVQDVGDGRATAAGPGIYTSQPAFQAAQTFPLRFLSPQAKVSIKVTEKVRWNAGFQYYGYGEDFSSVQGYRAHTGYSSLLWSF